MRVKMCTHTDGRRMTTINVYRNKVKKSTKTCDVKTSKPTATPDKFTTKYFLRAPTTPATQSHHSGQRLSRPKPQC